MWIYKQSTGIMSRGTMTSTGYSGFGQWKNVPDAEDMHDKGPIPKGDWLIGAPFDSPTHGPYVLGLTPLGHDAHGRTGFLIHGDSITNPGTASRGCIVLSNRGRRAIRASGDRSLSVEP